MRATLTLFLLTSLRHSARHKLRTLLTLLGIVAGVATFIFAPTLAASIARSVQEAGEDLAGRADLEIRGPTEGFHPRALSIARTVPGVAVAAPLVQAVGVLPDRSEPLAVIGIDPKIDQAIRGYNLAQGRFLNRSGEVLLAQSYAGERGLHLNQRITVIAPTGSFDFKIVGLLAGSGVARLNNGDVLVMPYKDAQTLRGNINLATIALTLQPAQDPNIVMAQLRAALPASLSIDIAQAKRGAVNDIQIVLNFVMGFTSFMILSVGSTLVYNTMAVAVAQRRSEIGVLRALGVTQRRVRQMFVIEAGFFGLVGSLVGILCGYALVQSAGQSLNLSVMFKALPHGKITAEVPAWLPFVTLLAGVGLPMLAGYLPARSAACVDPIEALSNTRSEVVFARFSRRRSALGLALLLLSVIELGVYQALDQRQIPLAVMLPLIISAELIMLPGVILLLPDLIIALGRILPRLLQRGWGVTGLLAAENMTKRPKRMTATATVLLVCAWTAVVTSAMNFGYRAFTDEWNASANLWDLTVSGAGSSPFKPQISLPAPLSEKIARRADVAAVVAERITTAESPTGDFDLRALDVATFRAQGGRFIWDKGDEETAYLRLSDASHPAILVSGFAAVTRHLAPGDMVTLRTPRGPQRFEVAGTVLDTIEPVQAGESSIIMDRQVYRRLWQDDRIDRLSLKLKPDQDTAATRRDLQHDYAGSGLVVVSPAEITAAFTTAIDNMVVVSQILSLLLLGTLIVGIANTFVIDVLDRRREMGLLRALGMFGRQVALSLVLEVIVLVSLISLLAVPMGMYTNYGNTLLMSRMFAIRFTLAPHEVLISLGLVLIAALLAAYLPARHAAKVDVLEALHYE